MDVTCLSLCCVLRVKHQREKWHKWRQNFFLPYYTALHILHMRNKNKLSQRFLCAIVYAMYILWPPHTGWRFGGPHLCYHKTRSGRHLKEVEWLHISFTRGTRGVQTSPCMSIGLVDQRWLKWGRTILRGRLVGRSMAEWSTSDRRWLPLVADNGTEEAQRRLNGCPNIDRIAHGLHRRSTGESDKWLSGRTRRS